MENRLKGPNRPNGEAMGCWEFYPPKEGAASIPWLAHNLVPHTMPPTLRDLTLSIKTLDYLIRKAHPSLLPSLQRTKRLLHTHFDLIHASEDSNLRKQIGLSEDIHTTDKLRKHYPNSSSRAKSTPSVPRSAQRVRTPKVYRRCEEESSRLPIYVTDKCDDYYAEID